MMVYILCVDASSGVEELDLVREEFKLCEVKERHLTATEETAGWIGPDENSVKDGSQMEY